MNRVLIGSTALKYHFNDFNRKPKDKDYAIISRKYNTGDDCMIIPLVCEYSDSEIASPEMLLTLKLSHIFFDTNWEKHMWDIQFLLSKNINYDYDLMLKLKAFWTTHYGRLYRSNLKQSSEDFFNNVLDTGYEHDYIHTLIASPPTYTKVLKGEVEICEKKVAALPDKEKDALMVEEIMVMAWERFGNLYYKKAYYLMMQKYIKNHVPMFLFDYLIKNYIRLSKAPYNFLEKINAQL